MTKALKFLAITAITTVAIGCSNAQEVNQTVIAKHDGHHQKHSQPVHQGQKKLFASVDIQHDFNGRAALGTAQVINLEVINKSGGGSATIEVLPASGLRVFNNSGFTQATEAQGMPSTTLDFVGDAPQSLSLMFQPTSEGVHNIAVRANVNLADGQFMTRTFNIPVYVGEKFQPTKSSDVKPIKEKPIVSDGLVIMDAEETIKD